MSTKHIFLPGGNKHEGWKYLVTHGDLIYLVELPATQNTLDTETHVYWSYGLDVHGDLTWDVVSRDDTVAPHFKFNELAEKHGSTW